MNCKPGQMATIVRPACIHSCVAKRIGCPVKVKHLVNSLTSIGALMEVIEGPMWEIDGKLSCPDPEPCEHGLYLIPDACLQPFEPGSEPEPVVVHAPKTETA